MRLKADSTSPWNIANLLTVFRIALILPFSYFIIDGSFGFAATVFFLAGLTDFADGYVARRFHQQSRLGQFLDPVADKLLITVAFVVLAIPRPGLPSIPIWLAVAVVGRDVAIALGSFAVYQITKFNDFKPTILGKINTLVELGLIFWFLVFYSTGRFIPLLPYLYAIVIASVAASGIEYMIRGFAILKRH